MERKSVQQALEQLYAARLSNDVAATRARFTDTARVGLAGAADDPSLSIAEQSADDVTALIEVLI